MTRWCALPLALVAAWSAGCGGPPSADSGSAFSPVATVDEMMDAIVIPSSQALFDSVVYVNGELAQSPTTDDEWFRLRMHAIAVAEAGNLLLMPPRSKGEEAWVRSAKALTSAASRAAEAASEERRPDAADWQRDLRGMHELPRDLSDGAAVNECRVPSSSSRFPNH